MILFLFGAAGTGALAGTAGIRLLGYAGRVFGTCVILYPFFLCRMLGAGDIKLMAVMMGILGIWNGLTALFLGLFCALTAVFLKIIWKGKFREWGYRSFLDFSSSLKRGGTKEIPVPEKQRKPIRIKLGIWLFIGYLLYEIQTLVKKMNLEVAVDTGRDYEKTDGGL